jgi:hypothetical protein
MEYFKIQTCICKQDILNELNKNTIAKINRGCSQGDFINTYLVMLSSCLYLRNWMLREGESCRECSFVTHCSLSVFDKHAHNSWVSDFSTDETITWFDGTPIDQPNWGIRKPDMDHLNSHQCVGLKIPEGVWQLSSCQEKKGFICKMESGG